ncbi:hypothetical protein BDV59DRAFT_91107 [Aspergillus ambiguus]|uniref:uncharacterized protein n=1 Tax=Aspergillus ambiguus TaxID=176160 RepID=UPI003CCE507A
MDDSSINLSLAAALAISCSSASTGISNKRRSRTPYWGFGLPMRWVMANNTLLDQSLGSANTLRLHLRSTSDPPQPQLLPVDWLDGPGGLVPCRTVAVREMDPGFCFLGLLSVEAILLPSGSGYAGRTHVGRQETSPSQGVLGLSVPSQAKFPPSGFDLHPSA